MGNNPADNGEGYVEVKFSVVVPEMADVATRSMAAPNIERLHLLVFDNNGLLSQKVNATLASTEWGETTTPTYFTATLARSDYKRTIHLIANSPYTDVDQYPMATESQILTTLTVSGTQDAYWQRVVLENGITGVQKTEGTGANQVVTYEPSEEVKTALTNVPLVRNHARVSVVSGLTSGQKSFDDIQFALVDIAASGTVVPYNATTGDFVNFTDATDYDKLTEANYEGYEPVGREIINHTYNDGDLVFDNEGEDWVDAGGFQYLYERKQSVEPAYVLVRGKYDGASTYSYYLVDIIETFEDENGDPQTYSYNLLRNIAYTVTITNVAGAGYATAEAAYEGGPGNNINASIKTKNLLNVSDGTSALYVEYTQKVINETGATVTLRYKYVTDLAAHQQNPANGVGSDDVTFSLGSGEVIASDFAEGYDTTDSDGWNTLSFTSGTCPAKNQGVKTQKLTLNAGSFSRTVEYLLVAPYTLMLDVPDKVGDKLGSSVKSSLILEEGLPIGIFPLEFFIVAENNSLSPDATLNTLPVVTGLNVDGTPGGQHFGYKFTLEYDEYYKLEAGVEKFTTTFPLYFKTNMAQSSPLYTEKSTVEGIDCYAYNQYHSIANDEYWIHKLYGLSLSVSNFTESTATTSFQLNTSNQTVTWPDSGYFDFDILSDHTLTGVTDRNGVAVSGASIVNSGKTLRITQAAYNAARNYTLTFSAPNITGTTMTISNAEFGMASATVERYAVSWGIVGRDNNTSQTAMSSGTPYRLRIVLPAGISNAVINTLKITATTTRTKLSLNDQSIDNNSTGTININSSMYDSSTGYIYVPITASTVSTGSGGRSFTLTLEGGDMFELPLTMTRTYSSSWGSYAYR